MVTPPSVGEYDLATRELRLLKQTEVRGGYDPADYVQTLEWATAADGARVPVSVVRKASTPVDGTGGRRASTAYGAYGVSTDPWFSIARLSWLDRGVVFAVAHVRGGEELGRPWYEDGRPPEQAAHLRRTSSRRVR
jgi:oligopeptidase B